MLKIMNLKMIERTFPPLNTQIAKKIFMVFVIITGVPL